MLKRNAQAEIEPDSRNDELNATIEEFENERQKTAYYLGVGKHLYYSKGIISTDETRWNDIYSTR